MARCYSHKGATMTASRLEGMAQDLASNDYDFDEILEIVKEAYELGKDKSR